MFKEYLPLGSVVLLKGGKKRLMITGFCMTDENDKNTQYDYCGCLWPEGILNTSQNAMFNHASIDRVYFLGFQDSEEFEFKKKLVAIINAKTGDHATNENETTGDISTEN